VTEDTRRDPLSLLQLLNQAGIERLFLPFIALQHLADVAVSENMIPPSLKEIITAGEQLQITPSIWQFFSKLPNCRLHNHYGPSEAHVVTAFPLPETVADWGTLPPIGRAIANTQIYLLDSHRQTVPIGVAGELYIAGVCLARGYLHQPELTAERFITDLRNLRLYKTGDLARYLRNGNLEYLGRLDNQVKIRGFRIELGEVETVLRQHPSLKEVVVIDREDQPGDRRLVAYVVAHQEIPPTTIELQGFLQNKLPHYMIPSAFVLLTALPFLPNGKIDRRALPAPDMTRPEQKTTFVAPRTPIEQVLAGIWSQILGLEQVGIHDNFFELGGHSLLATQVISQIRKTFQVELPLRRLFETPTVTGLAEAIAQIQHNQPEIPDANIQPVARQLHRIKL
jgi:acyl-coenzyme A synthetase/AMP-(fatty) acid ligase/acyl carrier protein